MLTERLGLGQAAYDHVVAGIAPPGDGRPGPSRYTTTCSSRAIVAELTWWAADEGSLHGIPTVAPKPPDHHRNRAVASCALALSGSAGASSLGGSHPSTATGTRIGALTVRDAFLPDPASSSVASIYLTVKNSGSQADSLIGVRSAAANGSMLMTENSNGTMGMLSQLRIPAHGQASLVPGKDHVMLDNLATLCVSDSTSM